MYADEKNLKSKNKPYKTSASAGKKILIGVAGFTAVGGFLVDWNKTHLFNPDWTPHAKFHDAMTITLGAFLGGAGLYFLLRNGKDPKQDIQLGTMLPAMFFAAQGLSFAFPGTGGLEKEFPQYIPKIRDVWLNERFASITLLALSGTGYKSEMKKF